jgi:adenosine kinase
MPVLICGSLAFDTITNFPGRFSQQIMPEQVHILNVSFLVPTLRREFGGCAGNIAYTLHQLGSDGAVMAALGNDGGEYLERLRGWGMDVSLVRREAEAYTAQAIIITDLDNNQITAFHPGAMQQAHLTDFPADRRDIQLAIIAPDGRDAMLSHAQQFAEAGVPFIFDPGQQLPMFDGDELRGFVERARWIAVNDYEGRLLCERMGTTLADLSKRPNIEGVVVTLGAEGSELWLDGHRVAVPGVAAEAIVDPTGCGDAYRAGLIHGILHGLDWETTGRIASLMGAIKIAVRGTQNHTFTSAEFAARYASEFGQQLRAAS